MQKYSVVVFLHKQHFQAKRVTVIIELKQETHQEMNSQRKLSLRLHRTRTTKYNRLKLIYDILLVIDTNLHPILHRFQVMSDYWSNFR